MSATNRGSKREKQDRYLTPIPTVMSIIKEIDPKKMSKSTFLEPCRGHGAIFDRVNAQNKQYAEIFEGIDYLSTEFTDIDLIVTNPPFSLALKFLRKSLSEADTVIYLLRLNFMGAKKRKRFWQNNPPSHLFVLSKRPSFTGDGTDACEYAFMAWDRGGFLIKPPGIYVI